MASDALAGRRILVMEDEFLIAAEVEQLCREEGADDVAIMRRLTETGGADDVAARFDVAILDLTLDGVSTLGLARQLWQRGIPFVFASGDPDLDEVLTTFPGVTVIGKPFAGADLMNAVAAAIRRRSSP